MTLSNALDEQPPPGLPIINTTQFEHWHALFAEGVAALQEQQKIIETGSSCSLARVTALTETLLRTARALTSFLANASYLQPLPIEPESDDTLQLEQSWLSTAIADLRVRYHQYSRNVVQIAAAMESRAAKAKRKRLILQSETWWKQYDNPTTLYSSKGTGAFPDERSLASSTLTSPTYSMHTDTTLQSWWSHDEAASPTGSMSTADDDNGNKHFTGWQFVGLATVGAEGTWQGWSPSTASSSEYTSHW